MVTVNINGLEEKLNLLVYTLKFEREIALQNFNLACITKERAIKDGKKARHTAERAKHSSGRAAKRAATRAAKRAAKCAKKSKRNSALNWRYYYASEEYAINLNATINAAREAMKEGRVADFLELVNPPKGSIEA